MALGPAMAKADRGPDRCGLRGPGRNRRLPGKRAPEGDVVTGRPVAFGRRIRRAVRLARRKFGRLTRG
jgi:hypothetical protein